MSVKIRALDYSREAIGEKIKLCHLHLCVYRARSKVKYEWVLEVDGERRTVQLLHSKWSGKKRVLVDGHEIYLFQRYGDPSF